MDPRPVMNTFFAIKTIETLQEEDAQVLAVWKHAWSAAGWNPRVLNLAHAKLHPDYDSADNDVKTKVPIHPLDEYNQLCYTYLILTHNGSFSFGSNEVFAESSAMLGPCLNWYSTYHPFDLASVFGFFSPHILHVLFLFSFSA